MRKIVLLLVMVFSVMMMWAENYASNARAVQVERTMVITYDLSQPANVRLLVATNMSNDFVEVKKVTGDVGKNVQAGANRQITWNVLEEYDRFVADGVRFMVEAYRKECMFSVSPSKKVMFSPGNLQYHPANKKWRFAESQLDYIGDANKNCSSTYNGWLDLFGWSTGATNFGVSTSTDNDDSGSFVDWGTNKIGNDAPNTWRTLTYNEWKYLLNNRPNAGSLSGVAQVNGVNGLILLPDNWTCPAGVTFKFGFHNNYGVEYYATYQTFTAAEWSKLEAAGAVFLPASGGRKGSDVGSVQYYGGYWSASESGSYIASILLFDSDGAGMGGSGLAIGRSVRLVKDLQ